MSNKHLVIFYHHPCNDGYLAACALKQQLDTSAWGSIRYIGITHSELARLPQQYGTSSHIRNNTTHVLFVDICPRQDVLKWLLRDQSQTVAILDHHETAKDQLEHLTDSGLLYTIADDFSGASLIKALGPAVNWVFGYDAWDGWDEIECKRGWVFANNDLYEQIDPARISDNSLYHLAEIRDIWLDDSPHKARADAYAEWMRDSRIIEGELRDIAELERDLESSITAGERIVEAVNAQANAIIDQSDCFDVTLASGEIVHCMLGELPNQMATAVGANFRLRYPDAPNTLAIGYFRDASSDLVSGLGFRSTGGFSRPVADDFGGGGHDDAAGAQIRDLRLSVDQVKQRIVSLLEDMD